MARNLILPLCASITLACATHAWAENWVMQQGTYPNITQNHQVHLIAQVNYTQTENIKAKGLLGGLSGYNGQETNANLVSPDLNTASQLQLARLHPSLSGRLFEGASNIDYALSLEMGNNGATLAQRPVISTASLSFHTPITHIRVGRFKLPLGEETLLPVALSPYLSYSNATNLLLNERHLVSHLPVAGRSTFTPLESSASDLVGGLSGFHDTGIELFDAIQQGNWEHGYAAMLSRGAGLESDDPDGYLDATWRLQSRYLIASESKKSSDVTMSIWQQSGKRTLNQQDRHRTRQGIGVHTHQDNWHFGAEYIQAKGMIFIGITPAFNDIGYGVQPVYALLDDNQASANGSYVEIGHRLWQQLWFYCRYDQLDRMPPTNDATLRANTTTAAFAWQLSAHWSVQANYEWRDASIDFYSPTTQANRVQRTNMSNMLNIVGDRLGLQFTYRM